MNKKLLFLIVGRTNSGKDTLVHAISSESGIPEVCSCTDRPMRAYEKNGVQHFFFSEEEMDKILETETVLAYTKIEDKKTHKKGYRYCTRKSDIDKAEKNILLYIIDPAGVDYLKSNFANDYNLVIISIMASENIRKERSLARGDSEEAFNNRCCNENNQFDMFENDCANSDYQIINNGELAVSMKEFRKIVRNETHKYLSEKIAMAL